MSRSPLADLRLFVVAPSVLNWTIGELSDAGDEGFEAFVLWGGTVTGQSFQVESALVPEQVGSKEEDGLLVTIPGDALFKVNKYFFEKGLLLGVQIHSHPTDAFHSSTDDHYPMATLEGALSIVVPYFARGGVEGRDTWAYYRLGETGWVEDPNGSAVLSVSK